MPRALLALVVCLGLLLPQGFARPLLWACAGEQTLHATGPCCPGEGHDAGASIGDPDDCCKVVACADDDTPATASLAPSWVALAAPPLVPERFSPDPPRVDRTPTRWRVSPPALGPPIWLSTRSLLI